jgi:hypothetical protein
MLRLTSGERKRSALASPRLSSTLLGHSLQAVSLLVHAATSVFAVPLAIRIHEGVVWSNRDRRTLLDKMLALLGIVAITQPCYFVADAYYAARKIVAGLLEQNNHLVTRMKSNAVAYTAHQRRGLRKRGRPRVYGRKIKLRSLLDDPKGLEQAKSPVYGERQVVIQYKVRDLLWRPAGRLVRFVAVIHPTRGSCLLMCTDTSLAAIEIIRLYGLRFKIEHTFKQAVRLIGSFSYHFWMSDMKPVRRRSGNQHLHRASSEYRDVVRRKLHAYHVFIQAAVVCQGLLQYLAVAFPQRVWDAFGSWLRTIRPGIPPSELVVANALRQSMPEFLLNAAPGNSFAKFVIERQGTNKMRAFRLASRAEIGARTPDSRVWIDDPEIVGHLIAVSTPVPRDVVAQEAEHRDAEVLERAVALVVGGMPVHQPP